MMKLMKQEKGFTVIELFIVIAIIAIMAAIAIPNYMDYLPKSRVNAAARELFTEMQLARMKAISENNDYEIRFDITNHSYSIYDGATLVKTIDIDSKHSGIQYGYTSGESKPGGGSISSAVAFGSTSPPTVKFKPTGLAPTAGSVYLKPAEDTSRRDRQRAITVGTTGRVRLYIHTGSDWD